MKIQPIGRGTVQIGGMISRYETSDKNPDKPLTAAEALYGFGGWLTSQDEPVTMEASHECGIVAELIDQFCKTNDLPEPRDNWDRNLIHP